MAQVGSFVVNTYMNNDNFLAGIKTANAAAKSAEQTIGSSISKINEKQLKNAATGFIKNFLGPTAAVSAGLSIGSDLVKGFSTGIYKDLGDVGRAFGEKFGQAVQSIPVAGAAFSIGESIGNWAFGVDKANAEIEKSKKLMASLDEQNKRTAEQYKVIQAATAAEEKIATQQKLESQKRFEDFQANDIKERQNAADILAEIITDTEKLGKTEMEIFLIDLKRTNLHSDEYQKIVDAKTEQLQLEKDISKESELQKQIQEWNTEDLKKGQEIADAAAKNLEQANRSNAMPGVDSIATAIGSVKVAGSADFSKQTELLNSAKKANDIASEQLKALRQIVDNSGGAA